MGCSQTSEYTSHLDSKGGSPEEISCHDLELPFATDRSNVVVALRGVHKESQVEPDKKLTTCTTWKRSVFCLLRDRNTDGHLPVEAVSVERHGELK